MDLSCSLILQTLSLVYSLIFDYVYIQGHVLTKSDSNSVFKILCHNNPFVFFFFFFQAEDGIRDLYVTGVQTCALPIWRRCERRIPRAGLPQRRRAAGLVGAPAEGSRTRGGTADHRSAPSFLGHVAARPLSPA